MSVTTEVKKGLLFIKEVSNKLKGDNVEALAAKISRKALSAVDGQIASLNSKKVDLENSLEEAQEALSEAIYPTTVFSSNEAYIQGILRAQKSVDQAQESLDATNEAHKYFTALVAKF
jgi:hypothetical protein